MAKYHPTSSRKNPSSTSGGKLSQFLWIFGAFVAGYFSSATFDFANLKQWFQVNIIDGYYKKNAPKILTEVPPPPPKPKLEFYTLLTKEDEELVVAANTQPSERQSVGQAKLQSTKSDVKTTVDTGKNIDPGAAVNIAVDSQINNTAIQNNVADTGIYTLQLAAFNDRNDAEKMKAKLALKGIMANIAMIEKDHHPWFRVYMGPYQTKAQADDAQQKILKSERISGMIRKASA